MKQILVLFIAIVLFCSCEKKYNYECTISKGFSVGQTFDKVQKNCTEKQIKKFIEKNTIDKDGLDYTFHDGDVSVICTKK